MFQCRSGLYKKCITNKDRLWERSDPRSYPIVGQARSTLYKKISFLKPGWVMLFFARALYSGRTEATAITLQKKSGYLHMVSPFTCRVNWLPVLALSHQPERNGRRILFITIGDWHFGHLNTGLLLGVTSSRNTNKISCTKASSFFALACKKP